MKSLLRITAVLLAIFASTVSYGGCDDCDDDRGQPVQEAQA